MTSFSREVDPQTQLLLGAQALGRLEAIPSRLAAVGAMSTRVYRRLDGTLVLEGEYSDDLYSAVRKVLEAEWSPVLAVKFSGLPPEQWRASLGREA